MLPFTKAAGLPNIFRGSARVGPRRPRGSARPGPRATCRRSVWVCRAWRVAPRRHRGRRSRSVSTVIPIESLEDRRERLERSECDRVEHELDVGDAFAGVRAQDAGHRLGVAFQRRDRPPRELALDASASRRAAGRARPPFVRSPPGRARPHGRRRRPGSAAPRRRTGRCRCPRTRRSRLSMCGAAMASIRSPVEPEQDRRAARPRTARPDLAVPRGVVRPLEVDRSFAEQRPDDRERLLEPADPMVEREPECARTRSRSSRRPDRGSAGLR